MAPVLACATFFSSCHCDLLAAPHHLILTLPFHILRKKISAIKKFPHEAVYFKKFSITFLLNVPTYLLSPLSSSCLISPVYCLLSHVSCLPVSCLTSPVSHLLSPVLHLLSHVSCLLSPVSCLLSLVSCLLSLELHLMFMSPVSHLLSHVSCLLSHISYLCPLKW